MPICNIVAIRYNKGTNNERVFGTEKEKNKMKKSDVKKYIAVIDPKVASNPAFAFKELSAKNLIEAMSEANKLIDDSVYLIDIYEKQAGGNKEKVFYKAVVRNRGCGWDVAERDSNILDTLAFYYKYRDASRPVASFDFEWVA